MTTIKIQLGTADTEITLGYNGFVPTHQEFPRADRCNSCGHPRSKHSEDKCLFQSTKFAPMTRDAWTSKYVSWAANKQLQDVLATIAYFATGGE